MHALNLALHLRMKCPCAASGHAIREFMFFYLSSIHVFLRNALPV